MMSPEPIDGWHFFVKGGKMDCVVDLEHAKCDCGVYGVEKIPLLSCYSSLEYMLVCISPHLYVQQYSKELSVCRGYSREYISYRCHNILRNENAFLQN
uniref:Uncharacterized protein n=1 Tax=Brassica oleracea TaxID=3712 RepID=A0A3P6B3T5_BRAOL|nr:unnamed protein product [Brassica oleracea]